MIDTSGFKPKMDYTIYIAATPDHVWQALTDPAFSRQYFFGLAVDIEPRVGGRFRLLYPDGRVHVSGEVAEWSPAQRLSVTWRVEGMADFAELPECLVTYAVARSGESVALTMTEAHSWEVPEAILSGGRIGWPKIMSSLKSVLETGKPLSSGADGPPPAMLAAVKRAAAEKPWLRR